MKKVLFLCTGNSCRSQIAHGWLAHLGGEEYEVYSAGIETLAPYLDLQEGNETEIENRANNLCKYALEIWKLDN